MPRKKLSQEQQSKPPVSKQLVPDDVPINSVLAVDAAQLESTIPPAVHYENFPIVGIGASAGGLAAFEAFFRNMPAETDSGLTFVVVQHLAPDLSSMLGELLQRFTSRQVCVVEDGLVVQPNCIYTIPPNTDISIFHGRLHLLEPSPAKGLHLPIDYFFRSLAQEKGETAIALVFSGAGSDGTLGVSAVKEAGGMVMVQTPSSADYDSMPNSAIATGLVDYVLPPKEMPVQLQAFIHHSANLFKLEPVSSADKDSESLQKILLLLRAQTRHDFSDYKLNTVIRRIERRVVIHQLESLDAYVRYLQQNPQEVAILFRELLIGVTRFFRDPEAFDSLKTQVLPSLFVGKGAGDTVRVWVPSCSTGEEAYSLAMLLSEIAYAHHPEIKVQIFATDIDTAAIETARAGRYPANIVSDVPEEYLNRYFTREEQFFHMKKPVRDMVVFAEQDLILEPPFSRLDLISCRNFLIYLNPDLQKKLVPLFNYALNPQGFLFLGSSETIGDTSDMFTTINRKWKIYQRSSAVNSYRLIPNFQPLSGLSLMHGKARKNARANEPLNLRTIMEQNLLADYTPSSVLIDESGEVLYVHGSTGRFLEPASGEINHNLIRMARHGFRAELASAVRKSITLNEIVRFDGLHIQVDEREQHINLLVSPVASPTEKRLFLVVFEKVSSVNYVPENTPDSQSSLDIDQRVFQLQRELHAKDEYLATHVEELSTAITELQSANEELQSTNEEMDTSREELHSVNEELSTVNAELQKKIEEYTQSNNDMNNLLAGTDVGTVFIDRDLRILRFTPSATEIVNLIPADIGRPIAHIAINLVNYDTLLSDARRVFETLVSKEVEVQATDGSWYLMRILPYRTQQNVIDGIVLTFVNISTLRATQQQLQASLLVEQANAFAESIVKTVHEPLLVLDAKLRLVAVNEAFSDTFLVRREDAVGQLLYDLGNGQWNIPSLRTLLESVLPKRSTIHDYLVTHTFEHIGPRVMRLNASEMRQANDLPRMILLVINDVTGQEE